MSRVSSAGRDVYKRQDAAPVDTEAETALREKFKAALDNDLNTALAVTCLLYTSTAAGPAA